MTERIAMSTKQNNPCGYIDTFYICIFIYRRTQMHLRQARTSACGGNGKSPVQKFSAQGLESWLFSVFLR